VTWFVTVFAGVSMVSNVPFYSFKDINLKNAVPFWVAVVVLLLYVLITLDQPRVLWSFFLLYSISGYVLWAMRAMGRNRRKPR
jgi:CDP-diacylglycerol--serine O-phosphatidyltransferase